MNKGTLVHSLVYEMHVFNEIYFSCDVFVDLMPKESWIEVQSNPSPLHDLDLQLIGQSRPLDPLSLKINWSINIDGSIHSITGTWIEVSIRSHTSSSTVKYRCDYQPAFTSNQCNYTGLEEVSLQGVCVFILQTVRRDNTLLCSKTRCFSFFFISPPGALFGLRKLLSKRGLNPVFTGPVRVLMVYPAVDSVFQHAVMTLADFLQSHKDLNVVIDMWQRGSLAEQGPLRWLHSQADQADKVLIILQSPQHQQIHTNHQKPHMVPGMPDYTVPASAQELYFLALNLVASSAHEPKHHHKFWVVHMNQGGERSTVPVQLRGCKTLRLPRDLNTLHQKLSSRQGQKCRSSLTVQLLKMCELVTNESPCICLNRIE
uniref:SEFIR domain-containing protein n=1 Tax=Astyanax mexicanus TaxID=7994 RepID=A0A8B9L7Q9_ASTMX